VIFFNERDQNNFENRSIFVSTLPQLHNLMVLLSNKESSLSNMAVESTDIY